MSISRGLIRRASVRGCFLLPPFHIHLRRVVPREPKIKRRIYIIHTHGAAGCYARVLSFTLMERRYMRRVDGVRFPGAILELIPQAILSARTLPTSCQCTHAGARPPASIARGTPSTTSLIALMSITTQPSTHKNTPALQLPSINTFIRIQPFPSSAGAMLKNSSPKSINLIQC